MNKILKFALLLSLTFIILGCSSDSPVEETVNNILVKTIVVNGSDITDGQSKQLSVVVLPSNASNRTVTWSVSNSSIATISDSGVLMPLGNGSVIVTAKAQDESTILVEKIIKISGVTEPPVLTESIIISGTDIIDGSPQQLSVKVLPVDVTNKVVTWSVSNTTMASITLDGLLTPKLNGAITVIATATDGTAVTGELQIDMGGVVPVYITILKAENMLLWQRNNGGWPKEPYNDFSGYNREQTASEILKATNEKNNTDTTIDNNHTIVEITTLLNAYKSTSNPNYLEAAIRGIDYILEAQYENGGWPQYYPLRNNYSRNITFNDNAMVNVMNLMWDIYKEKNNMDIIDSSYKTKAFTAFNKGIDVILQTQIMVNGTKTAWCAQHSEETLLPVKARSYELASISGAESVGVVRTLMLVEQPSTEVKQAVIDAMAWFEDVKIVGYKTEKTTNPSDVVVVPSLGSVMWARFYDIETNQPFFCGRNGIKKNTLAEIEIERRTGYSYYGNWPGKITESEYNTWKNKNGI